MYRVFCALDATVFARCFGGWMAEVGEALGLNGLTHIAIDGKSLRGATGNTFTGCVHVVTAWATEYGLVLGREVVADRSNEIPAFTVLLSTLKLRGTRVTIDAAGCQTDVVDAAGGGGTGDPRADGGWQDGADDDVLHHQPEAIGGDPCARGAPPLGD